MNNPTIIFRVHAIERIFQRNISVKNVSLALQHGETIEDYSEEMSEPTKLILAFQGKRPFHVVVSENQETNEATIITVYVPDPDKWDQDFKVRRS